MSEPKFENLFVISKGDGVYLYGDRTTDLIHYSALDPMELASFYLQNNHGAAPRTGTLGVFPVAAVLGVVSAGAGLFGQAQQNKANAQTAEAQKEMVQAQALMQQRSQENTTKLVMYGGAALLGSALIFSLLN